MKKIVPSWGVALLAIGFLAGMERLAFELTGSELARLNQGIDLILTVSCLLFMWLLTPYQIFHYRDRMSPETAGKLLLGSFIGPLLIVLLVTVTVNDLDGGLLLLLSVVTAPVIAGATLAILGFHQKRRSGGHCKCHQTKHITTRAR